MLEQYLPRFTRRHVLKGAALGGLALLCPAPVSALADASPDTSAQGVPAAPVHTQTKLLMGTFVTLSAARVSQTQAEEALGRAFEEMSRLEGILSRHNSATPLATLNAQGKLQDAPAELTVLVERALRVHSLTHGAFDATVAPVLDLFRAHSNPQGRMHLDRADLKAARELVAASEVYVAPDHVRLGRAGMALTLDGIAKGHIADRASMVLAEHGVHHHLVNAGGDIRVSGQKAPGTPWRVAVEQPHGGQRKGMAESLAITGAIATSGSYEIYYDAQREHHHLIDPVAKASPQHSLSVSVTAPTALEADALATALSVMPAGDALRLIASLPGRECCLLARDGAKVTSAGWGKA